MAISTPSNSNQPPGVVAGATILIHGTPDPYLTHFDPRSEHQSYKQAQMRLEEIHKEEVTKVSISLNLYFYIIIYVERISN
jgi:amyloid beta A4 protein